MLTPTAHIQHFFSWNIDNKHIFPFRSLVCGCQLRRQTLSKNSQLKCAIKSQRVAFQSVKPFMLSSLSIHFPYKKELNSHLSHERLVSRISFKATA